MGLTELLSNKAGSPYGGDQTSPLPRPTATGGGVSRGRPPSWILRPIPVNERDIQQEMNAVLASQSPELQRWLYSTWNAQGKALKYQEIRNAIRDGEVSPAWVESWRQDYARLINERLAPAWMAASRRGSSVLSPGLDGFAKPLDIQLLGERMVSWVERRGGELAVDLTATQQQALNNVLRRHLTQDIVSNRTLAQMIRPLVGLTNREAGWVQKRLQDSLAAGTSQKQAVHTSQNFAGFLSRRRAERIARTEMSFAFNYGALETMRQARQDGLFGTREVVKEWFAQRGERTCPWCGELHGKLVQQEETFPAVTSSLPNAFVPPAHPHCRCTILYNLVEGVASETVKEPPGPEPDRTTVAPPTGRDTPPTTFSQQDYDRVVDDELARLDADFLAGVQHRKNPRSGVVILGDLRDKDVIRERIRRWRDGLRGQTDLDELARHRTDGMRLQMQRSPRGYAGQDPADTLTVAEGERFSNEIKELCGYFHEHTLPRGDQPMMFIQERGNKRAFFAHGKKGSSGSWIREHEMNLHRTTGKDIVFHEAGHWLEDQNVRLQKASYYNVERHRRKNPPPWFVGWRKDGHNSRIPSGWDAGFFGGTYQNKEYFRGDVRLPADPAMWNSADRMNDVGEVLSMTTQYLDSVDDLTDMYLRDPDSFAFLSSAMRGRFGFE